MKFELPTNNRIFMPHAYPNSAQVPFCSGKAVVMRTDQLSWSETTGWRSANGAPGKADLVLYFATRQALTCGTRYRRIARDVSESPHPRMQYGRADLQ